MTGEELDRAIEFMLNRQAHFEAWSTAEHERAAERMTKIESVVLRLANGTERRAGILEQSLIDLADAQKGTQSKLDQLTDDAKETRERLHMLIDVAERYFSQLNKDNGEGNNAEENSGNGQPNRS